MEKKTILLTGCSEGGIGAALARALASRGHHVFATARNTSKIPQSLTSLANVTIVSLDVTSKPSIEEATKIITAALQAHGFRGLDVLVNNSGRGYTMPLLDVDVDEAKDVYDVNVFGTLRVIQAFSDLLIQAKGRVVNTPWIGIYSSSKSALINISETLRLELSPFGVSVVTLMTGTVSTPFHANEPLVVLPPTSHYKSIKDTISQWATGEAGPKGCPVSEFASSIVDDVIGKDKSGLIWRGPYSSIIKWGLRLLPTWMIDSALSNGQGLHELTVSKQA